LREGWERKSFFALIFIEQKRLGADSLTTGVAVGTPKFSKQKWFVVYM
jgi:hypothetical protein